MFPTITREVLWVAGAGLEEGLIFPAVQGFEHFAGCHIKHQHTAVYTMLEGHAEGLEPFLTGRVGVRM